MKNDAELKEIFIRMLDKLSNIADKMYELVKVEESLVPDGIVETYSYLASEDNALTTTLETLQPPIGRDGKRRLWRSVTIYNHGNNDIRGAINVGRVNALRLEKGKTYFIDVKVAKIEKVTIQTVTGTSDVDVICMR